jgi:hypothetical protein
LELVVTTVEALQEFVSEGWIWSQKSDSRLNQ